METTDEDVLRLAKALAVEATGADAVVLGGVSLEERMKLLVRACSMRDELELLIKQLANSAKTSAGSSSRINPVRIESRRVEVDTHSCTNTPMQLGTSAATEPGQTKCCEHLCGYMNPALWSKLPVELLPIIFSRLRFPHMYQYLRLLSKEWKRNVTEPGDPASIRAFKEAKPKMLAMVFNSCKERESLFSGTFLYDFKANIWYFFRQRLKTLPGFPDFQYDVKCASRGLVCYVTRPHSTGKFPVSIFVCNPLTRQCKQLPYHSLSRVQPSMVQLVVNRDTKCYQVTVVVKNNGGRHWPVQNVQVVCNCVTRQWSSANTLSSCIFGFTMNYNPLASARSQNLGIHAFDCARNELIKLDNRNIELSESSFYILLGDHLFVLYREPIQCRVPTASRIRISEYQAQTCKPNWVKLRTHECDPLNMCDQTEIYSLRLDACEGCLMVTAYNMEHSFGRGLPSGYKHERAWLYDLCTGEWKAIAPIKGLQPHPYECLMYELHWDAVPQAGCYLGRLVMCLQMQSSHLVKNKRFFSRQAVLNTSPIGNCLSE